MKKFYLTVCMLAALVCGKAQQVATFEEIELSHGSFYNGSDKAGGFESGGIWFINNYDAEWASWNGFSVSNMKDTVTAGFFNQYSAIPGIGSDSSENYAMVYPFGNLELPFDTAVKPLGFYVTNSVYAYISMRDGDLYSKKFGGADGTEPDYYILMVYGTDSLGNETDTLEFYLADFRFENSTEDYIVDDWKWFDLSSLGVVNKLTFMLDSSDKSDWGMNTPAYFCIDNFTLQDFVSHSHLMAENKLQLFVYPNPANNVFQVVTPAGSESLTVTDRIGRILAHKIIGNENIISVDALSMMPPGMYFLSVKTQNGIISEKILKN